MAGEQPKGGSAADPSMRTTDVSTDAEAQTCSSNIITFIHCEDSLPWAQFLQAKLLSDNYNIRSTLQTPHLPPGFFFSSSFSPYPPSSSPYAPTNSYTGLLIALIVSPRFLEPDYSSFWASYVELHKGPSLVILLGVEKKDLRDVLGTSTCARVLSRPWVQVTDRERSTVSQALIKLIQMYESVSNRKAWARYVLGSLDEEEEEGREEGEDFEEEEEEPEEEPEEEEGVEEEEEEVEKVVSYGQTLGDHGDDEDPYDIPRSGDQRNRIVKVIPTILFEDGPRDVVVVMGREPEAPLTLFLVVKNGDPHPVRLTRIAFSTYLATIPKNLRGKVPFWIECAGDTPTKIGFASINIRSRLEQLHSLLQREVNPVTALSKAVKLPTEAEPAVSSATNQDSLVEKLDALLARRLTLSELPPGLLEVFCPEEFGLEPEYNTRSQWPTMLHFAAEFNLVRVCEALLEYPGMIHAACTENRQGLFPCILAEKQGFKPLHLRLLRYVQDIMARDAPDKRAADSGISFPENLPPPKRHGSMDSSYVNERRTSTGAESDIIDDEEFMKQGMMYVKMKGRSCSEGRIAHARPPSEEKIAEEDVIYDILPTNPPPLKPKRMKRAMSVTDEQLLAKAFQPQPAQHPATLPTRPARPLPPTPSRPSAAGSDSLGGSRIQSPLSSEPAEPKVHPASSSSSSSSSAASAAERAGSAVTAAATAAGTTAAATAAGTTAAATAAGTTAAATAAPKEEAGKPGDDIIPGRPAEQDRRDTTSKRTSRSSWYASPEGDDTFKEEEGAMMRSRTKRSGSLQEKLSNFFQKIKAPRRNRSSSDTSLTTLRKGQKVYVRHSSMSTKSDPTFVSSTSRSSLNSEDEDNERDSGALCEDRGSKKKRMSVRVLRAKNEDLSETPSIPPRSSSSTTTSGIIISSSSSQRESTTFDHRL